MREIAPYVYVSEAKQYQLSLEQKNKAEGQPDPSDGVAITRWLAEKVQNKRHESGRINFLGIGHSNGPAHTVCPYVSHFFVNIEDGVKELVVGLHQKGYLTYSSCAGHEYEVRYVGLAFPSEQSRAQFIDAIRQEFRWYVKAKLLKFLELESVVNTNVVFNKNGAFDGVSKAGDADALRDGEADFFNIVFYRRYSEWTFLKFQVGYEITYGSEGLTWRKRIEQFWVRLTRRYIVPKLTKRICLFVGSPEFPAFDG